MGTDCSAFWVRIMRIFKYNLQIIDDQNIHMPKHSDILTVQNQNGRLTIWTLAEDNHLVMRRIKIVGTGNTIDVALGKYIGTVQMDHGFVWHVFDQGELP